MIFHFYWTYLETQKGPNYWYEQSFFVWCLLRQRNGGWNSGQKPATIVTSRQWTSAREHWCDLSCDIPYWNKNEIDHVINTISMREKYSFIAYHWIYGHSTLGYQNHVKPSASLRLYMIFIPEGGMAVYSMAAYERVL